MLKAFVFCSGVCSLAFHSWCPPLQAVSPCHPCPGIAPRPICLGAKFSSFCVAVRLGGSDTEAVVRIEKAKKEYLLIQPCPLVIPQAPSPSSPEVGFPAAYIQELSPQLSWWTLLPLLLISLCNLSAESREYLSGAGFLSVADLKGFLALIRADVFQQHLAAASELVVH